MASPGLVGLIQCSRPDLVLVSSDGQQSYTWRILLALHSPWVSSLLVSSGVTDCGLSCLSIPAPQTEVQALLASLASHKPEQTLQGNQAANLLQINTSETKETEDHESDVGEYVPLEEAESIVKEECFVEDTNGLDLEEKPVALLSKEDVDELKPSEIIHKDIGEHVVEFVEKEKIVTCYLDWKYQYNRERTKPNNLNFSCVERHSQVAACRASMKVKKYVSPEGVTRYQAMRLSGQEHSHPEQQGRVLVDYARHRLKLLMAEEKQWETKTMKQIYEGFVDSFTAELDEEKKALFSILFPSFTQIGRCMWRWKRSSKHL